MTEILAAIKLILDISFTVGEQSFTVGGIAITYFLIQISIEIYERMQLRSVRLEREANEATDIALGDYLTQAETDDWMAHRSDGYEPDDELLAEWEAFEAA
jgi:hypothetical protein